MVQDLIHRRQGLGSGTSWNQQFIKDFARLRGCRSPSPEAEVTTCSRLFKGFAVLGFRILEFRVLGARGGSSGL